MRRRDVLALLSGVIAPPPLGALAQPTKPPRIGVVAISSFSHSPFMRLFSAALRELGYRDGQNILLEWSSAEGRLDRLDAVTDALVRTQPDVIVTVTNAETAAAKRATATIPIVMLGTSDPAGTGLVDSLARPGGNVTGSTWFPPETAGKTLAVLKEAIPDATRVGYVIGVDTSVVSIYVEAMRAAASSLGVAFNVMQVPSSDDASQTFEEIRRWRADALVVSTTAGHHRQAILKFAEQSRTPAMYSNSGWVETGGLMAYAPSLVEAMQRTARYVDRILKGAKPADLPVEQPTRFELVVNLKTARAMGIALPPGFLARADEVIE